MFKTLYYSIWIKSLLVAGRVDEAMLVVIEARKAGIEKIPGLNGLDAKQAHLVRAGLAAGRLLSNEPKIQYSKLALVQ